LAERNRTADNVEFILYDGVHIPVFPSKVDLILSVGVLQYMGGDTLKRTVYELVRYLKSGGRFYLIEQASDNLRVGRPSVKEYLKAFEESKLECLRYYPIRNGRWWLLYLIRYGLIAKKWFRQIAVWELKKNKQREGNISYYKDYLFLIKKT